MYTLHTISVRRLLVFILMTVIPVVSSQADYLDDSDWLPLTESDLAITESTIDPESGVEVLFRELKVDDKSNYETDYRYYTRIKVFNEHGVDELKSIKIDTEKGRSVSQLKARVILPDGSINVLNKKDVFTREIMRYGDERYVERSFSLPGLTSGAIIEYRWKETGRYLANNTFFQLATRYPVRLSRFRFRPYNKLIIYFDTFKIPGGIAENKDGYWEAEVTDLPAASDEPFLPSSLGLVPWIIARYTTDKNDTNRDQFWEKIGKDLYSWTQEDTSKRWTVRNKAAELTPGMTDPMEKLRSIYTYCHRNIVNTSVDNSGFTAADRQRLDANSSPADTIKRRRGTGYDILVLFTSLTQAAGFESVLALCNDRSQIDWDINCLNYCMTPDLLAAVNVNGKWMLFQPEKPFLPFGYLIPGNSGTVAIIGNNREATFVMTDKQPSDASKIIRSANLVIDEDGMLEGTVSIRLTGYRAMHFKLESSGDSQSDIEDSFRDEYRKSQPLATLTDFTFKNIDDPDADVEISFKVSVPGYSDVTEERLFIQPCFFQKGKQPLFSSEKRECPIRFAYTNEILDTVSIHYPESMEVEEEVAPHSVINDATLAHLLQVVVSPQTHGIVVTRNLKVNFTDLPVELYPKLRTVFEEMKQQDDHILILHKMQISHGSDPTPVITNN